MKRTACRRIPDIDEFFWLPLRSMWRVKKAPDSTLVVNFQAYRD